MLFFTCFHYYALPIVRFQQIISNFPHARGILLRLKGPGGGGVVARGGVVFGISKWRSRSIWRGFDAMGCEFLAGLDVYSHLFLFLNHFLCCFET